MEKPTEGMEFEAPGLKGRVFGKRIVGGNALLLLLILAVLWTLYTHDVRGASDNREVKGTLREVKEALDANTYVLSLSQDKREKLEIAMPDSLRQKVRR